MHFKNCITIIIESFSLCECDANGSAVFSGSVGSGRALVVLLVGRLFAIDHSHANLTHTQNVQVYQFQWHFISLLVVYFMLSSSFLSLCVMSCAVQCRAMFVFMWVCEWTILFFCSVHMLMSSIALSQCSETTTVNFKAEYIGAHFELHQCTICWTRIRIHLCGHLPYRPGDRSGKCIVWYGCFRISTTLKQI